MDSQWMVRRMSTLLVDYLWTAHGCAASTHPTWVIPEQSSNGFRKTIHGTVSQLTICGLLTTGTHKTLAVHSSKLSYQNWPCDSGQSMDDHWLSWTIQGQSLTICNCTFCISRKIIYRISTNESTNNQWLFGDCHSCPLTVHDHLWIVHGWGIHPNRPVDRNKKKFHLWDLKDNLAFPQSIHEWVEQSTVGPLNVHKDPEICLKLGLDIKLVLMSESFSANYSANSRNNVGTMIVIVIIVIVVIINQL